MRLFSTIKLIIFSIILSMIFPNICFADPIDDKRYEQDQILQTINIRQNELDQLSNDYTAAMIEKEQTEEELETLNNEIDSLNIQIEDKQNELLQQCTELYKMDKITMLDVILSASDFKTLISNVDFYNHFINQTNKILNELIELKAEAENKKIEQETKQEQLEITIQEIEESQEYAAACIEDLQAQYNSLDGEMAVLVLQQQLGIDQSTAAEVYNSYIEENAIELLAEGNASEQIYQLAPEEYQSVITNSSNVVSFGDGSVVDRAYAMLGSPYAWGGTTSSGFDCSGFVSYCLTGEEGTRLGTTETFMGWSQTTNPQPGDICVNSGHTGVYVGNGNMVHAATYGIGVIESPVQDGMIYVTYSG